MSDLDYLVSNYEETDRNELRSLIKHVDFYEGTEAYS